MWPIIIFFGGLYIIVGTLILVDIRRGKKARRRRLDIFKKNRDHPNGRIYLRKERR